MHRTLSSALLAVAVLALGAIAQSATAAQEATVCAPAPGTPLTVAGNGDTLDAGPFYLDGGEYTVSWSMSGATNVERSILLSSADDRSVRGTLIVMNSRQPGRAGHFDEAAIRPGMYILDVTAPAGWSVTFTPIAA